jgi:hypothetical protein
MNLQISPEVVKALETFFAKCGTRAEYCVELDDAGGVRYIVCTGANYTDKKILRLLEREEIANAFSVIPEVRFIATRITRSVTDRLLEINPRVQLTVISIKEWRGDMDRYNKFGSIRYGRWPKAVRPIWGGRATDPERYGLVAKKPDKPTPPQT